MDDAPKVHLVVLRGGRPDDDGTCPRALSRGIQVSEEDTVSGTVIEHPPDGQQIGSNSVDVRGRAQAGSRLQLQVGDRSFELVLAEHLERFEQ